MQRRIFLAGMGAAAAAPAWAHGATHDVAIRSFTFDPPVLNLAPGEHVRFTNHDLVPHTATANDHSWDTGEIAQGQSVELMIGENWTGEYYCVFHPAMTAQLIIESA